MRRRLDLSIGIRSIVALVAALGLAALLAPSGSAQTLPERLPQLPALPSLPSLPANPPAPAPPAPSLPSVPLPTAPLPAVPLPIAPLPSPSDVVSLVGPVSDLLAPLAPGSGPLLQVPGDAPAGAGPVLSGGPSNLGTTRAAGADPGELISAGLVSADSAARLARLSPADRRRFLAKLWDEPPRGAPLRRLRARLREHWSCAGVLTSPQRRVLVMRAGLFGGRPAAWRTVARRVGASLPRVVRLARSGLARLSAAGTCIHAGGAALGTSIYPVAPNAQAAAAPGDEADANRQPEVSGVLGAVDIRPDVRIGLLAKRDNATPRWLLAFLTILLALLAAAALAARRGALPVFAARALNPTSDRPLLFLDVDGVIALKLLPGLLPAGKWHEFGLVRAYVSWRAAERVCALATRYEIVWATGWEQGANRHFRPLPGVEHDLHVLEFGLDASSGSSDWKIKEISRTAGRRPAAWVDDGLEARHKRWARSRSAPTLLVQTDPHAGISEDQVKLLLEWADGLSPRSRGRFQRRRSTERVVARR